MTTQRTITRGTYKGHDYYKVDGYSMPSPSKIKLDAVFLDNYHAAQAVNAASDHWDQLAAMDAGSDRRGSLNAWILENYQYAAEAGREKHRLMEALVNGQPAVPGDKAILRDPSLTKRLAKDPSMLADAEAAARCLDAFKIQPFMAEQGVINTDYWYSGTLDMVATCDMFGAPSVLDYKFGRDIYPEFALQLGAYNHATHKIMEIPQTGPRGGAKRSTYELEPMPPIRHDMAFILHSTNGLARLVPVKTDGWVWDTVQAWVEAWWSYNPTVKDDPPLLAPLITDGADDLTPSDPAPF